MVFLIMIHHLSIFPNSLFITFLFLIIIFQRLASLRNDWLTSK